MILANTQKMLVNIRNRKKTLFEGRTESVTSLNEKGEFDVLPFHANFISLIHDYVILAKGSTSEQKFTITTGVLRAKENKVDVFLDV